MQFDQLKRRDFITLLGGVAARRPRAATAMPVVGFLSQRIEGGDLNLLKAFHQGLRVVGYTEGRNVAIEYRIVGAHTDQLRASPPTC